MEHIAVQIFIYGLFLGLGICLVLLSWLTYRDSDGYMRRQKRRLSKRLGNTRLPGVLARLGIPLSEHVRGNELPELRRQLRQCRKCWYQEACVNSLRRDNVDVAVPIPQCPNRGDFLRYLA